MESEDDLTIWEYAREHGYIIATQDSDFADFNRLRGAPPKILWLRCGNQTVTEIERRIRTYFPRIQFLETDPKIDVVEVW